MVEGSIFDCIELAAFVVMMLLEILYKSRPFILMYPLQASSYAVLFPHSIGS